MKIKLPGWIARKSYSQLPVTAEWEGNKFVYYLQMPSVFGGQSRVGQLTELDTPNSQILAYEFCAPLSGIIQRKVTAHLNAKLYVIDKKGDEAQGAEADRVRALLTKPNVVQTWKQFEAQAKTAMWLHGEVFIYSLRPVGSRSIAGLFVLPNEYVRPIYTGRIYQQTDIREVIAGYEFGRKGATVTFDFADVLHIKDQVSPYDPLRGMSRVVALSDQIINIVAAYEARNVLATKRGALGILTGGGSPNVGGFVPMLPKDRDELQAQFQQYGISRDKFQVIISPATMQWQQMSFPTKDLMLFEEIEDDVRQIADNYNYPMFLLGFKSGTTFSNVKEAKLSLYQDAVIPENEQWIDALNSFLGLDRFKIAAFYDHLAIFQEDEQSKAAAILTKNQGMEIAYRNGTVTLEEWREALGYDPTKFNGKTFYRNENTTA